MPKYKITSPDGRTISVTGDKAPTPEDLEQIFASLPTQEKRSYASGVAHAAANGFFGGLGDEISATGATLAKLGPDAMARNFYNTPQEAFNEYQNWEKGYNEEYNKQLDKERALQDEFTKENPVSATVAGIGGAIANPLNRLSITPKGTLLGSKTLAKAATSGLTGGIYGGIYGFNEGRGGLKERLQSAKKGAKIGGAVGVAGPIVKEGIKQVGNVVVEGLGQTSGAGSETLKRGFDAGKRNSQIYKNAMRGQSGVYDVVDDVDKAVRTMERNASAKYKAMLPDNGATLKLPETEFKTALKKATDSISGVTAGVDDTAQDAINKVHKLAQNMKVAGGMTFNNTLEAKKAIDGIIEPLARKGEKNAVRLLTPIKNALNNTLESAVPEYNGARAAFRADSRLIDSIKSALTSQDPTTELRKLQGITRQSVAAAQGGKQELGRVLDNISGGKILDAVAGGQVQQWMPRDPLRAFGAGAALLSGKVNPVGLATVPAFSPRLLGEGAFGLGRLATAIENTASKLPQSTIPAFKNATTLQLLEALGY